MKLVVSDLDGTLLNQYSEISDETKKLIIIYILPTIFYTLII